MYIDISLCSSDCPFKNQCLRGKTHKPGIYTISNFYLSDYKTPEECEYYIKIEKTKG